MFGSTAWINQFVKNAANVNNTSLDGWMAGGEVQLLRPLVI